MGYATRDPASKGYMTNHVKMLMFQCKRAAKETTEAASALTAAAEELSKQRQKISRLLDGWVDTDKDQQSVRVTDAQRSVVAKFIEQPELTELSKSVKTAVSAALGASAFPLAASASLDQVAAASLIASPEPWWKDADWYNDWWNNGWWNDGRWDGEDWNNAATWTWKEDADQPWGLNMSSRPVQDKVLADLVPTGEWNDDVALETVCPTEDFNDDVTLADASRTMIKKPINEIFEEVQSAQPIPASRPPELPPPELAPPELPPPERPPPELAPPAQPQQPPPLPPDSALPRIPGPSFSPPALRDLSLPPQSRRQRTASKPPAQGRFKRQRQHSPPHAPKPTRPVPFVAVVLDDELHLDPDSVPLDVDPGEDWTQHENYSTELARRQERSELAKWHLESGRCIAFRSSGWSLFPDVYSGDLCYYEPVPDKDVLEKDDIVFCKVNGKKFYAHYVQHIGVYDGQRYFTIANAEGHVNGYATDEQIYGKMYYVDGKHRRLQADDRVDKHRRFQADDRDDEN